MIKIEKNNINLLETLTSGQCFRVYEESDNSFVVVLNDRVVNIKEENDCFVIKSNNEENLEFKIKEYLDYTGVLTIEELVCDDECYIDEEPTLSGDYYLYIDYTDFGHDRLRIYEKPVMRFNMEEC